ncbi:hypothetical protein CPter291_3617 [Collimonas pratensis]|uniref:Uncharacterized protein n=1 Tax=Collimonas pratensis TaxID=279113 RepID=A0ABM5Z9G5_9BURK|nr:hypothetical protein CPter291_3617 [Collimonas pratensis]
MHGALIALAWPALFEAPADLPQPALPVWRGGFFTCAIWTKKARGA